MDMRTPAWLLLAASLFSGCMTQAEAENESAAAREQGLWIQALPYEPEPPAPPATEIPSCWWVDDPADCDVKPKCVPEAPSDVGIVRPITLAVSQTSPVRRTTATLARSPTRGGSSPASSGLSIKANTCPPINGVPACSTCSRLPSDPAVAKLQQGLYSRVLVSNGTLGNYMVKNYPQLLYSFYSTEGTDSLIPVDLEEDGETDLVSGSVDFEEDLYMFFTGDYDTGPYPMGYWVFCPKNGNTCVQVTE